MKKMLMKVLAAFLLVVLLASTNGITVLAEGVAEEVRDAYNSEESAEDETSESEESTTEETTEEAVSEEESVSEETEEVPGINSVCFDCLNEAICTQSVCPL